MKKIHIVVIAVLLSMTAFAQQLTNVVFIMADDLGIGDLGCYGQKIIRTPNIDKLAANGTRFTQFYAGTSVCAPSRASLMTGLHTGHTAIRGNFEIEPEGQFPLPGAAVTIAEIFKRASYVTGAFGKWGLGYPGSEGEPNKQGFDTFFGYNCQRQSHNYFPDHLWYNGNKISYNNSPVNQQSYAPDIIQQKAIEFITANRNKPFFLYLPYTLPHAGLQLPPGDSIFEGYKKQLNEVPKNVSSPWDGKGYQPQPYPLSAYAAMVTKLDGYVGEVLNTLKELGIDKNTVVIFTSDNGPHREGGNMPEYFNSNGGFRGIKRDLYEGGIRIPMIASWPNVIKAETVSDYVGAFWDFLPSFAQLVKQPVPGTTDGISLLPVFTTNGTQKEHEFLYWEFHEDGGRQAVRMGNWKAVRLNVTKNPGRAIELYNLAIDPAETIDRSDGEKLIVKRMERIMQKQHTPNKRFPLFKGEEK